MIEKPKPPPTRIEQRGIDGSPILFVIGLLLYVIVVVFMMGK